MVGASDTLQIYSDGSNSFIKDTGSGVLVVNTSECHINNAANNENMIKATENGSVDLYHNGSKKFETYSDGVITTGHSLPNGNNSYDLGSTSLRWRNIYTNDLHLSNEGSSNDVDSTWGDWTIQEGESDLFLKNNRSGKKYKFNLTEVS